MTMDIVLGKDILVQFIYGFLRMCESSQTFEDPFESSYDLTP